jgi:hypothetical protein
MCNPCDENHVWTAKYQFFFVGLNCLSAPSNIQAVAAINSEGVFSRFTLEIGQGRFSGTARD